MVNRNILGEAAQPLPDVWIRVGKIVGGFIDKAVASTYIKMS